MNGWFGATYCAARRPSLRLRANAASAIAAAAQARFVRSPDLGIEGSERPVIDELRALGSTLSLSALVVHLLKAVVPFIVTPVNEYGTVIDAGAILAPAFETDMGGG
jgi:hypothetical protein